MFGSRILEVAIGIIFIFLVSMICSAIREGIESWVKSRAAFLEHGIRELLHDRHAVGLARSLYTHPRSTDCTRPSIGRGPRRIA